MSLSVHSTGIMFWCANTGSGGAGKPAWSVSPWRKPTPAAARSHSVRAEGEGLLLPERLVQGVEDEGIAARTDDGAYDGAITDQAANHADPAQWPRLERGRPCHLGPKLDPAREAASWDQAPEKPGGAACSEARARPKRTACSFWVSGTCFAPNRQAGEIRSRILVMNRCSGFGRTEIEAGGGNGCGKGPLSLAARSARHRPG